MNSIVHQKSKDVGNVVVANKPGLNMSKFENLDYNNSSRSHTGSWERDNFMALKLRKYFLRGR
jgi:hypothetical protein